MSKVFNDTTNLLGIVQGYEKEIGATLGDVSGSTTRLKEFTADTKSAFDHFWAIALPASGTWQLDDSNHSDYNIITTTLTDGQRDYAFTNDGSGNSILEVQRVFIKPSATASNYVEIYPIDQQSQRDTLGFTDGQNAEGVPYYYDKTGNGIFLDPIPSYTVSAGLKIYISREASYFTYTDTTKKPGVPGLFHDYFFLKPAADYLRRTNDSKHDRVMAEVLRMEKEIEKYYGHREKDIRHVMRPKPINYL